MPTPGERRALILVASVAALGVAARGWREFRPRDPGALAGDRSALARQIEAVDSAIAVSSSARKPRAGRAETQKTQKTQERQRAGSAPDDPGVPGAGVGPASSTRGRRSAPAPDPPPGDPREAYWKRSLHFDSVRALDGANAESVARRPARGAQPGPSDARGRSSPSARPPVDLDIATIDEAATVPLIGPGLARRIVMDRIDRGPFGSLQGLERIPGMTAAFTRRLAPFVTFSRAPRLDGAGESRPRSKSDRRPRGNSHP